MKPSAIRKCPGGAALVCSIALIGWVVLLAPDPHDIRTADPTATPLRAPTVARRHADHRRNVSSMPRRSESASRTNPHASDVIVEAYRLRGSQLATLRIGERIVLPHPDGGTIELQVARLETSNSRNHLTLTYDGLVSTFTMARGSFFGTLATAQGVYALQGDAYRSTLIRHALLDQRINSHALDYRTAPSS